MIMYFNISLLNFFLIFHFYPHATHKQLVLNVFNAETKMHKNLKKNSNWKFIPLPICIF